MKFNKTIIPFAFVAYEMIIANLALRSVYGLGYKIGQIIARNRHAEIKRTTTEPDGIPFSAIFTPEVLWNKSIANQS